MQSLDLTGRQEELLQAVHATGTPTVLVLVNGRALSVRWAAANVPAIVEAWLPGERGASAVADVLFGDHDPGGRLPVTVPAHVGQLPAWYNAKPSKRYWAGRGGYVDGDGDPLFPFGHGLSYTTFAYEQLEVAASGDDATPGATVSLVVRNTGERAGTEVVQLYVGDRYSSVATPSFELRGFRKLALEPGEQAAVRFELSASDLAMLDASGRVVVEAGVFDVLVGASSEDVRLRGELHVGADAPLAGRMPLEPSIGAQR
jgi:beta-glucosidase